MSTLKTLISSAALAALAIGTTANAAVRPAVSNLSASTPAVAAERSVTKTRSESQLAGVPLFAIILGVAATIAGIVIIADDGDESPA